MNSRPIKGFKLKLPELKELIASNDKQRFSLILASSVQEEGNDSKDAESAVASPPIEKLEAEALASGAGSQESEDPADYLIRANQGHSIKVDTEALLTPITVEAGNVPDVCVHGTDEAAWEWGSGG